MVKNLKFFLNVDFDTSKKRLGALNATEKTVTEKIKKILSKMQIFPKNAHFLDILMFFLNKMEC